MQKLTVEAKADRLDEVIAFVDSFLEAQNCPMKAQMQIDLCVEEIFINIANYAYPDTTGTAEIRIAAENGIAVLTFIDAGLPYDPLQRDAPDITLPAEEREIGGLGIFLVRKNTDTVFYCYEDGKNVLTITKAI
ncbi:MAG: ATP-binding protein [Clostridia bacterium]|nr:ATP-binding protein [Clostridia bacterium]